MILLARVTQAKCSFVYNFRASYCHDPPGAGKRTFDTSIAPPPPFVGCWCHGDDLPGQYVNRKEASRDLMRPILFDFRLSTRYLWPLSIQSRFSAMPQVFPRSPGDCYSHWLCSTRGRDPTARILDESFTPTVLWGFHLQHEGFHGWVQALREGSLA